MSEWRWVEIYTTFLRITGELEGPADRRLTDLVAGPGPVLDLRAAAVEAATDPQHRLGEDGLRLTVVKAEISLVCPRDQVGEAARDREGGREKQPVAVQLSAQAFSMRGDVHLEPGVSLDDHLCREGAGFIPVTGLSALWLAGAGEPRAVQRGFALLNCATLVSFAPV
ncbi:MAG TPA: hypothetical protein VGP96_08615 [Candidatus Dormibacteraeota bacterium]|jgi:hypothetical protein|nr:hypothetical protein [Candidatus Dormibacteraeota bacterium]